MAARRTKRPLSTLPSVHSYASSSPAAEPLPAPVILTGAEQTCALPPSEAWPPLVKRLLAAQLARWGMTWTTYAAPWGGPCDEAMRDLLRMTARALRATHKVLATEEAWTICLEAARAAAEKKDPKEPDAAHAA